MTQDTLTHIIWPVPCLPLLRAVVAALALGAGAVGAGAVVAGAVAGAVVAGAVVAGAVAGAVVAGAVAGAVVAGAVIAGAVAGAVAAVVADFGCGCRDINQLQGNSRLLLSSIRSFCFRLYCRVQLLLFSFFLA